MQAPGDVQVYIDAHGLKPMGSDESETQVRDRVAVWLRERGCLIEAQEVAQGRRWDSFGDGPSPVVAGVAGAIAVELGIARRLPGSARRQLDDEVPIGFLAASPPNPAREALGRAFDLLGPAALELLAPPARTPEPPDDDVVWERGARRWKP